MPFSITPGGGARAHSVNMVAPSSKNQIGAARIKQRTEGIHAHPQCGLTPSASESLTRRNARAPPPRPRPSRATPTAVWRAPQRAPCSHQPRYQLANAARARASRQRAPRAAARRCVGLNLAVLRVRTMACAHARVPPSVSVARVRHVYLARSRRIRNVVQALATPCKPTRRARGQTSALA